MATTQALVWINDKKINGRYAHSAVGSDINVTGLQATASNPAQSLNGANQISEIIVADGYFSEEMSMGTHSGGIYGTQLGKAIFDGKGKYHLYGYYLGNMICIDVPPGDENTEVNKNTPLLVGLGRATTANHVGNAHHVHGVGSSSNIFIRCGFYYGAIGGNSSTKYNVYASPQCNSTYKIKLVSYSYALSGLQEHHTIYDCRAGNRTISDGMHYFTYCLFAKFDIFLNDNGNFDNCVFLADCHYYVYVSSGAHKRVIFQNPNDEPSISYSEDKLTIYVNGASNPIAATQILIDNGVFNSSRYNKYVDCKFGVGDEDAGTGEISQNVFNDADNYDFSIVEGSIATGQDDTSRWYYGALAPAQSIRIFQNSDGKVNCWEHRSAKGMVGITADNEISLVESTENTGEVRTKVIRKTDVRDFTGIFTIFPNKFATNRVLGWEKEVMDTTQYKAGDELPVGKYLLVGKISYQSVDIEGVSIINVTAKSTTFIDLKEEGEPDSYLVQMLDANLSNAIYVRTKSVAAQEAMAADKGVGETLSTGWTYINESGHTIQYAERDIVSGESFECEDGYSTFQCAENADAKVKAIFKTDAEEDEEKNYWIPSALFTEYFASRNTDDSGEVYVADGVAVGSGYYKAYASPYTGAAYVAKRTRINETYVQLRLFVQNIKDNL